MPQTLMHHLGALSPAKIVRLSGDTTIAVTAPFVEDSRAVEKGGVFVARKGLSADGHQYIDKAIEQGAVAIIGEQAIDIDAVPYVQIRDAHLALGQLAASYYGFPSRQLTVFGVTGTNGKTTTTHLLHSILKIWTKGKVGYISTLGADFGGKSADTGLHVTTPHAPHIQKYLAQMLDSGLTHVILEMTSHGLEQGRLSGVDIDVSIVTNVTHEHLDFHGSFEAYQAAKGIMFQMLANSYRKPNIPKISILNQDDDSYSHYAKIKTDKVVTYSIKNHSDNQAFAIRYDPNKTYFAVDKTDFQYKLFGEFNIYNALAAVATARAIGIDDKTIIKGLQAIDGVSGRMERIDEGQDFIAIVDFAHTPDALEKALVAGRTMVKKGHRLIAVFGSAGLRDVEKRRMMAETSAKFADITILTAEDPRTESLKGILQEMADGCLVQGGTEDKSFFRIPDRGEAIYQACQMAKVGDVVMICGKGHEQSMCFGTIEYPWDDRDALRAA
ncbi:MAG: UDP-N-acetylmuramoyl-L-alanyl-D-glutamate--2,6-diaminopimelate ligase [Anaerolineae bacterium]|nr:UDP-N-acetylmuramoyl-L-alanyl-D-glutamate--2,6-diaminopimelate ligase [Anaerolineae bacterium]